MGTKKRTASVDTLVPDVRYGSALASKFINCLMHDGKKSVATRVFYDAMDQIKKRMPDIDPIEVFKGAVENVKPSLEVRSRRVGGANYQVPIEVPGRRARTLAVRWLVTFARQRREKEMVDKFVGEIIDASNAQGGAYKKKDDIYRMAQANKAFAHYRW